MSARSLVLGAVALVALSGPLMAKQMSDKEKMRAEAEHLCYDDVMRLCPNDTDSDDKAKACMKKNRAQLSPECAKVFDKGMAM